VVLLAGLKSEALEQGRESLEVLAWNPIDGGYAKNMLLYICQDDHPSSPGDEVHRRLYDDPQHVGQV
jgi:hypothetical protein